MKNVLVVLAVLMLLAGFVVSISAFVYVALFWFRADLFQLFVLMLTGLASLGFWNAFDYVTGRISANTCLRDLKGNK
jgi:hypothetical protein